MQGNITIYTSNESFEESQKLRTSLRKVGFAYHEQDISSKPGKSFS
jgi:arsenate reductase-like glutaredoxin family protein